MSSRHLLAGYRCTFCLLILIASAQTLVSALRLPHVAALAVAEIAGAVLLLGRRTQWLGLAVLLLVFGGAKVMAARHAAWPTHLLQYAASALLIVLLDRSLGGAAAAPAATAG
jgi:hypothetical protein